MTRSREAVTQQTLDDLQQQIKAANGDPTALRQILEAELKLQEEAEWTVTNQSISDAVDNLCINAESYTSSAEYRFVRQWVKNDPFESFPTVWHKFVSHFMTGMNESDGGKVILNLEYDLGITPRPSKELEILPDESGVEHEERLDKQRQEDEANAIATMAQFKTETAFWTEENLCRVFISYLSTLPNIVRLSADKRLIPVRNVIDSLFHKVLDDGFGLSNMFNEYVETLELVMGNHQSRDHKREDEALYKEVKAIYDDLAILRAHSDELTKINEWQRVNKLVVTQPTSTNLYSNYVSQIESLHCLVSQPATSTVEAVLPRVHVARYLSGGIGLGATFAAAVMLGLVLGGVLTAAAPVLIIISLLTVATIGTFSGMLGLVIGKYLASKGIEVSVGRSATETVSVIKKACSTTAIALFLGCTGASFAADVVEPATPAEQQNRQDDQDDTKEAEATSSLTTGKRPGSSSFR